MALEWLRWSLTALSGAAKKVEGNRSNSPGVRDLESMLAAFEYWKSYYSKDAKEHRERFAKLELIGDREASWEKRARDSSEQEAARCEVGAKVLRWAISELKRMPEIKPAPQGTL